jgi:hypothetical protein
MANIANITFEYAVRAVQLKTGKTLYALATTDAQVRDEAISLVFQTSTEPLKSSYNLWETKSFPVIQTEPEVNPTKAQSNFICADAKEQINLVKRGLFNIHLKNFDEPTSNLLIGIATMASRNFPNLNPTESAVLVHTPMKHMIWKNAFTLSEQNQNLDLIPM